ncbi:MAG TPA: hypothetical protein VFW11_20200 [Cyclobacteriaceae bacterium]|nr:hypothetical protein [Cyclobacteriaceae bacterium]
MMKKLFEFCFIILVMTGCNNRQTGPETRTFARINGWNILSDNEQNALSVIDAAGEYNVNHVQLSHQIVHDLREAREEGRRTLCNKLIDYAHAKNIQEVLVWDHALYPLDYYPDEFKTGPDGTLDLDNEEFWEWFRNDYRQMLDLVPHVDGIILTFIETGARAENQYSVKLKTAAEKLAKVIDEVAEVVINERNLKLYARTFIYTKTELANILSCIDKIKNDKVMLMVKEVPHDFFLTHPVQSYIDQLKRPVLIEFDAGHEYSGQGIIANTFVEKTAERWRYYQHYPQIIGYVARTDRYGTTKIIDRPSEILLHTLHALSQDPDINDQQIYDDFISKEYGKEALPHLKSAFSKSYDIVTSSLYTLGLCMANHSKLSCDYQSTYNRFVSGRWMKRPVITIDHDVNKEFHYYKDIVDHLAPKFLKETGARLFKEDPFVADSAWVHAEDLMNREYLTYIMAEKDYGVRLSTEALNDIEEAEPFVTASQYHDLYDTFYRTLIKARLSRGAASAYFAYRIWCLPEQRDQQLLDTFWSGIDEMNEMAKIIQSTFKDSPKGQ